jgi:hypothetical protein
MGIMTHMTCTLYAIYGNTPLGALLIRLDFPLEPEGIVSFGLWLFKFNLVQLILLTLC